MAQEPTNQSQAPLLCTTGCGFYGNPRKNGMCSVCYKDFLQRQNSGRVSPPVMSSAINSLGGSLLAQCSESAAVSMPTSTSHSSTAPGLSSSGTEASADLSGEVATSEGKVVQKGEELHTSEPEESPQVVTESEDKPKAKKNRCFSCRKKVGLTGFDCRCGNVFCSIHRYSDLHNCTFDYKAEAAEKIRKENPVIVGEKIQKI